jgi:hypothetical protein
MNNKFKVIGFTVLALLACTFAATAQLGGTIYPQNVMRYYASGSYFSTNGTALTGGFTNTLKVVDISKTSFVSLALRVQGEAECTNVITLRAWPSADGVNKLGVTAAAGTVTAASAANAFIWNAIAAGTTLVNVQTNLPALTTATSAAQAPYLLIQVENPASPGNIAPTNLVLTLTGKTP